MSLFVVDVVDVVDVVTNCAVIVFPFIKKIAVCDLRHIPVFLQLYIQLDKKAMILLGF